MRHATRGTAPSFLVFLLRNPLLVFCALVAVLGYYYMISCVMRFETLAASVEISGFSPGEKVVLTRTSWFRDYTSVADKNGVVRVSEIPFGQWMISSGGTPQLRERTIYIREYARRFYPKEVVSGPARILYTRKPMFGCVFDDIRVPVKAVSPGAI